MHTTADDPKKYRADEEVKEWEPRDPLLRFAIYLRQKKLLGPKVEQVIDEEIAAEIEAAIQAYEQCRADPLGFFEYMYAEMTPELRAQHDALQAYLDGHKAPPPAVAQPRVLQRGS